MVWGRQRGVEATGGVNGVEDVSARHVAAVFCQGRTVVPAGAPCRD